MTREEAIEYLHKLFMQAEITDEYGDMDDTEPYETAIDMAVEALKFRGAYEIAVKAANKAFENRWTRWVEWIPCSERLPEHTGFYLIQHSRECCADEMAVAFYSVEEHEIDPDDCWEFSSVGDVKEVIAWMPLPKPYQENNQ